MANPGYDGMWLPSDQDPRMQAGPAFGERANISLLGLVRHMARVEQSWFRRVIEGHMDIPRLFQDEAEDAGFNFPEVDDDLVRASHALWQDEIAYARAVLDRTDLDAVVDVHGESTEVRDIIVHMIEEYARHCGHADLVRECVDGRAGQ